GKEALVEIKKHNPEVKAFFISGYTDDILQGEGMAEHNVPLLHKPIAPKVLLDMIRDILKGEGD
ncbi:MAG: hypothetical protein C0623_03840, partial [Desulfuromonas sp.]